ncbi:MAG: serine/threonine protein kinase [Candidatus Riflebacteria bacterium]|nr:serine/threonine protein kinase [Candidatus Riflebacteria bacterium]
MTHPFPGDCASRYDLVEALGEWGFGSVYLATQKGLQRQVAVKLLHADALRDREQQARFLDEARITASLSHPHIVRLLDHGCETGVPWIVYEYLPGPTLRRILADGPMPWRKAVKVVLQVASALEEAHGRDIVHRDITAENVIAAGPDAFKVVDFGISRWTAQRAARTRTGFIIGTPTHLAPEILGGQPATARSDLYALGVMFFEMLTGRLPFDSSSVAALMKAHISDTPVTPSRLQPDLPATLDDVISRLLVKDPEKRMPSASALLRELDSVMASHSPSGRASARSGIVRRGARPTGTGRGPLPGRGADPEATRVAGSPDTRPAIGRAIFGLGLLATVTILVAAWTVRPALHAPELRPSTGPSARGQPDGSARPASVETGTPGDTLAPAALAALTRLRAELEVKPGSSAPDARVSRTAADLLAALATPATVGRLLVVDKASALAMHRGFVEANGRCRAEFDTEWKGFDAWRGERYFVGTMWEMTTDQQKCVFRREVLERSKPDRMKTLREQSLQLMESANRHLRALLATEMPLTVEHDVAASIREVQARAVILGTHTVASCVEVLEKSFRERPRAWTTHLMRAYGLRLASEKGHAQPEFDRAVALFEKRLGDPLGPSTVGTVISLAHMYAFDRASGRGSTLGQAQLQQLGRLFRRLPGRPAIPREHLDAYDEIARLVRTM